MANNYKKNFLAFTILLATTIFFINGCSKSKNPVPNDQTQVSPTDNAPTISSLSTTTGVNNATVIIYGTNFSTTLSANRVFFNGKAATVTAATSTQLTVTAPADAGTGPVTISVNNGATVTGPVFTYTDPLKITSIDVDKGTPGTTVKITGTGFSTTLTDNKVFFNGKAATVTAATTTLLTVTVPAGAGTGSITVSLTGGTTATGPTFTYIEVLSITSTDVDKGIAGATVNINGTGFSTTITDNKVFFNGMAATVTAATAIKLTVKVPTGAGVGKITLTLNGQSVDGPVFNYYLSSTVTTIASNDICDFSQDVGAPNFLSLTGIICDGLGNIYVCDINNFRVRKITPSGLVTTIAGNGYINGSAPLPENITIDKEGNIYFTQNQSSTIRKIAKDGTVSIFAGAGSLINATSFSSIIGGITTDDSGNLYLSDSGSGIIREITSVGVINLVDKKTSNITYPFSITLDGNKNIYVVDNIGTKNVLDKISASKQVTTISNIPYPRAVAAAKNGDLYVVSDYSYQIKVINPAGIVSIVAGSGIEGRVDGDQFSSKFTSPPAICLDPAGNILITEGPYVRKITINK